MLSEYAEEEAVKHKESACLRMQRQNSSTVRSCQCGRTDVLSILEKCINTQIGTDGRPIIRKKTSVTGRHMQPILVFRAYGCILVSMVHLVHGRREHMALQGIRRIAPGIVQDPAINSGRPIIEGTRVFVDRIIGHLEHGMSIAEICHEYDLTSEQVMAVKDRKSTRL